MGAKNNVKILSSKEATRKVASLRDSSTDKEVAEKIGISKNTLYKRLAFSDWKKSELAIITLL